MDVVTYLPASIVRAVGEHAAARSAAPGEAAPDLPWHVEVDGTMVMADLSDFTALSERLARLGEEGAERLTDIINSFFERMLKTASRHGGDTLTFGGDAILLLFDGLEHATRAAVAALEMLRQVERAAAVETDQGKVKIGMSVGAHSDTFVIAGAGLPDERAHLIVLGQGGEQTALAEAQAGRGQLAVSAGCGELLPAGSKFEPAGDFWLVNQLAACALPDLAANQSPVTDEQLQRLRPFLPPYARSVGEGGAGHVGLAPEHRRVVIVFVDVLGLNGAIDRSGLDAAVEQLQAYAAMLTRLAAKHQGFVVSSDIATKGSKLIITFGAPVAHEYAPANAARFALDLNAELLASGLELNHKIGVNGGHVFAGEVGPPFRRQYTVMGDAVNLAARLMAAAEPGQALVSRNLLNYVSHTLCARELPPIRIKGKEQPVAVCVLEEESATGAQIHGSLGQGRPEGRLFGRRKELDQLARAWEQARRGKGHAILVEGEAGIGKSRLVEESLRPMSTTGRVTRAACFEHLQAAPFTPWVEVLQAILGVLRDDPRERRTATVQAFIDEHLTDMAEFGALLDPLLDLALPQTEVVASLDAQSRRAKLFELITRIVTEPASHGSHVLVVEDVHWMDESSLALAGHLARRLGGTPTLLLLTTRPAGAPPDLGGATTTRIVLADLTESESLAMVREALGADDLPTEVGDTLYAKTKGNPLFLEEVIHSLQAPGVLERILSASSVTRAAELAALEIPDRVQGLLMSRIDRLPPDTREVLKAGSVVGRSFDVAILDGIDDESLRQVALDQAFVELVEAALVVRDGESSESSITFRHALVQDVAYGSLPFARRRYLHGRVARYLESAQAAPDHGLLVHHYQRAGDAKNTRLHAVKASESSVAVYANLEAVDYLSVALNTARGRNSRDAAYRSRFEEMMGDSLQTLARYDEAVACFSRARRRWASPAVREISDEALGEMAPVDDRDARDGLLCWKIAVSVERGRSAYTRAIRWLDRGAIELPPDRKGLAARMLVARCAFLARLGRFREALTFGEEGLALARLEEDAALQAYAVTELGLAYSGLGLLEKGIRCDTEAARLYERAGDLRGLAASHSNLAAGYFFTGDLAAALEHDETSLGLYARIGNINGIAGEHQNLGGVLLQMGEIDAALKHLEEVMRLRDNEAVSPLFTGFALICLCQAHVWTGDLTLAGREIAEATEIFERIDARGELLDAGVKEAELRLALGELAESESSCASVLSQARSMGAEQSEAQALCMLGRVRLARGDPEAAAPGLEACIALAEKIGARYERAQALAVLAEAREACAHGDSTCEDLLGEAIKEFERMGARYDLAKALQVRKRLQGTSAPAARSPTTPG